MSEDKPMTSFKIGKSIWLLQWIQLPLSSPKANAKLLIVNNFLTR